MTKPTKWMCAQQRLRSAWASAQSDQSLHCPHEETLGPQLLVENSWRHIFAWCGSFTVTIVSTGTSKCIVAVIILKFYRRAVTWQNQQNECAPSKDSDQPGHPPSLIRVFAVRMKKPWVLSYPLSAQRRLWSDWADAQADLSLRWVHIHFVGFVMSRLRCGFSIQDVEGTV